MIFQVTTYVKAENEAEAMKRFGEGAFISKGLYICKLEMTEEEILNMQEGNGSPANEAQPFGESEETDVSEKIN